MSWTPARNRDLASRIFAFAQALKQAEDMADDIFEAWFANSVSSHEAFESVGALTEQDITDGVTLADHYRAFLRNAAVATTDRASTLARLAGGPLEG